MGSPEGRRESGHGYLAGALLPSLPTEEDFPYAIHHSNYEPEPVRLQWRRLVLIRRWCWCANFP